MIPIDAVGKLLLGTRVYIQKAFVSPVGISLIHLSTGERFVDRLPFASSSHIGDLAVLEVVSRSHRLKLRVFRFEEEAALYQAHQLQCPSLAQFLIQVISIGQGGADESMGNGAVSLA